MFFGIVYIFMAIGVAVVVTVMAVQHNAKAYPMLRVGTEDYLFAAFFGIVAGIVWPVTTLLGGIAGLAYYINYKLSAGPTEKSDRASVKWKR